LRPISSTHAVSRARASFGAESLGAALIASASEVAERPVDRAARFGAAIANPSSTRHLRIAEDRLPGYIPGEHGGSHEALSRPRRSRQSDRRDRLLFGAVRRAAVRGESRLRQMDAR